MSDDTETTQSRTRINVRSPGDNTLQGYFILESATKYREQTEYANDLDERSVNTGSPHTHQTLYLTKGGQWVLSNWSDYGGTVPQFEFVSADTAKQWLLLNDEDGAAEEHFGPVPEEAGPDLGGRPAIGPTVRVAMPAALRQRVDAYAKTEGISRAHAIRTLVDQSLPAQVLELCPQNLIGDKAGPGEHHYRAGTTECVFCDGRTYVFNKDSVNRMTKHAHDGHGKTLCPNRFSANPPMPDEWAARLPLCGGCRTALVTQVSS